MKIATVSRNYIRQRLGVQHKQDMSQNGTLGYSVDKAAGSRHSAINKQRWAGSHERESQIITKLAYFVRKQVTKTLWQF